MDYLCPQIVPRDTNVRLTLSICVTTVFSENKGHACETKLRQSLGQISGLKNQTKSYLSLVAEMVLIYQDKDINLKRKAKVRSP
jgi:hypothetical protein